jgi:sec-independent protein translocase protein TatC
VKDLDDTKAPLLDHLTELRTRLLLSIAVLVFLFIGSWFFAQQIFGFLVQPLIEAGQGRVIFTDVFEAFFVDVKVALFTALMIGFPFFAIQIWKFVAPGLYAQEKRALLPFLLATPVFFTAGAAFAYYIAMPAALRFLLGYEGEVGGLQRDALPGIGNYLSFSTRFLFAFGVAFLLPILLMILERAGLITRQQLAKGRRYAIVGIFTLGAVLTPPDVISQFMLAIPLYALYEMALLAIRLTHWRAERRGEAEAGAEADTKADASAEGGKNAGPEPPPGGGRVGDSGPI